MQTPLKQSSSPWGSNVRYGDISIISLRARDFTWEAYSDMRLRHIVKGYKIPRLPFNMQYMVDLGQITAQECEKYVAMLASSDEEMQELAITILKGIKLRNARSR